MAAGVELGTRATMAATLTFERRKSLADQVADTLVEAIGLGLLQPGERMVETEIAARFNVSRVPVREALKILATQGILQGEPHRGLYVIEVDDLVLDQVIAGAAVIEERGSTTVVPPGWAARVIGHGELMLEKVSE